MLAASGLFSAEGLDGPALLVPAIPGPQADIQGHDPRGGSQGQAEQ